MVGICPKCSNKTYLVILSSMLLGSRMKVGRVMRLRSAPGLSCEIIDSNTASPPISVCTYQNKGEKPTILLSIIDNCFLLLRDGIRIQFLTRITFKWKASATAIQTQSLRFPEPFLPFQCQPPFEMPLNHLLPVFELPATGVE